MNFHRDPNHWCNDGRREVLCRDYPAGMPIAQIRATLAEIPGTAPPAASVVGAYAVTVLRLRRPEGYQSAVRRAFFERQKTNG